DLGHRTAGALDVALPEAHRDADHVVAGLEEHGRGDRGVDAARHGGQDLHNEDRSRSTAGGMTSRARSTSSSVVVAPSDRRREPAARSLGTPIAVSTWEGSTAPLVHAEPAEAHTPAPSRRTRRASDSTPANEIWQLPATLLARSPVSTASGMAPRRPSARRSRRICTRATVSARWRAVASMAAAMPTMPATL